MVGGVAGRDGARGGVSYAGVLVVRLEVIVLLVLVMVMLLAIALFFPLFPKSWLCPMGFLITSYMGASVWQDFTSPPIFLDLPSSADSSLCARISYRQLLA